MQILARGRGGAVFFAKVGYASLIADRIVFEELLFFIALILADPLVPELNFEEKVAPFTLRSPLELPVVSKEGDIPWLWQFPILFLLNCYKLKLKAEEQVDDSEVTDNIFLLSKRGMIL